MTGLEADLFYVHEGAINTYAMHFTVPVPADVQDLEFSWQSLTTYPVSVSTIHYSLSSMLYLEFAASIAISIKALLSF